VGREEPIAKGEREPFEDFTGRLDIAGTLRPAATAMYLYDVEPGESLPYNYEYVEEWVLEYYFKRDTAVAREVD
jgi:hypothetical protein